MTDSEKLQKLVGHLTNQPSLLVALESWPTEYGLDSLSILVFREQCENQFGIIIPDDDWAQMHSLDDIVKFLSSSRRKDQTSVTQAPSNDVDGVPTFRWGSEYMAEVLEIGMPLTGVNQLSENGLLKYLGDLRWRNIARTTGVSSRNIVDASDNRLYPTFFYVELSFPIDRPMAHYGENDRLYVIDSVRRYGLSMLDGITFIIPADRRDRVTRPLNGLADAEALGIPAVRMSNIFVMKFDGAEWLKKGRPKQGLIDGIRELADPPDSVTVSKQAERDGHIVLPDDSYIPLRLTSTEYDYEIEPDRDVNGVGLLYFANYPLFLDFGERAALHARESGWPDELINKRTIVRRKIAYLNNASWKDALTIKSRVWIKVQSEDCKAGRSVPPAVIFTNQQMYRKSDGRLMCVSSSQKILHDISADQLNYITPPNYLG